MIEIKDLEKTYKSRRGKTKALRGVNLKLPSKGLVAIYGENGCGKTTLLNAISTIDRDYKGEIYYNGVAYKDIKDELRRNVISVVLQDNQMVDFLNVSENIELSNENNDLCQKLILDYGLDEKREAFSDELSGGQKQRANVVRGLSRDYSVLLVDEPTSSMNSEMETEVFKYLRKISEEKLVLLVSHNITLIRKYSDFVVHMDNGQIVSMKKNECLPIKYNEDGASIPSNFYNLAFLDDEFVIKTLDEKKHLYIEVTEEAVAEERTEHFEVEEMPQKSLRKMDKDLNRRILKNPYSLKNRIIFWARF